MLPEWNPFHTMTVEELITAEAQEVQAIILKLHGMIVTLEPGCHQTIWPRQKIVSYGLGPRKMTEHYLYLQAHRKHANLGFYHALGLPDPENLLQGTGKSLRHIKFNHLDETRHPAISEIMHHAIAERKRFILRG
jgi:Domain of unknown function (DU1801)